jgi:adenylate cyclase
LRSYEIRCGGVKWEIDEFGGENQGLIVAEVETDKQSQQISKPDGSARRSPATPGTSTSTW